MLLGSLVHGYGVLLFLIILNLAQYTWVADKVWFNIENSAAGQWTVLSKTSFH